MKHSWDATMLLAGVLVWNLAWPISANAAEDKSPQQEWEWLIEPVEVRPDGAPVSMDFVVITQFPGDEMDHVLGNFCLMGTTLHAAIKETDDTKKHFLAAGIDSSGHRVSFVARGGLTTGDGMSVRYFRVQRDDDESTSEPTQVAYLTKLGLVYRKEASIEEKQAECANELKQAGLILSPPLEGKAFLFAVDPEAEKKLNVEAFRGRVVLIDSWATWCSPCLDKMPWLIDLSRRFEPEGLVVVSVNLDESRAQALRTLERFYIEDSIVQSWKSLGLFEGEGAIEKKVLAHLRDRIDGLSSDNEQVVLSAMQQLGVLRRMAAEQGNIFERIGVSWTFYHVPEDVRECFQTLVGGSLPSVMIVGPDGILRYHGYPLRTEIEEMLRDLLSGE